MNARHTRSSATIVTATLLWAAFFSGTAAAEPPQTPRREVKETLHGNTIIDPYRWLEPLEAESPEVMEWTEAQNQYTRDVLDQLPCHAQLVEQFQHLMAIPSIGTPRQRNGLLFNTERREDQNQGVLYVRGKGQAPRVLIDPNSLDEDGLVSLDWWNPSPDGSLLAFGLSHGGNEMSTLHVLKTETGEWTPLEIPGKANIAGWTPDGGAFLYSLLSDPTDPYSRTVRWHQLGRHPRHDPTLATQKEPGRIPYGVLSRNGRWILLGLSNGWSSNDLWVVNTAEWQRTGEVSRTAIAVGKDAKFRPQLILENTLFMLSTLDAPNASLVKVDLESPQQAHWLTIVAQRNDAVLQGASEALGMLVISWEKDATTSFQRIRPDGSAVGPIALPGLGSAGISTDPENSIAYMSYTSYNEPRTVYRVDLKTGERIVWARPEVSRRRLKCRGSARVGDIQRRHPHPHVPHPPRRHRTTKFHRSPPDSHLRLRRLQHLAHTTLLCHQFPVVRSWWCLRGGESTWRQRIRRIVAPQRHA